MPNGDQMGMAYKVARAGLAPCAMSGAEWHQDYSNIEMVRS